MAGLPCDLVVTATGELEQAEAVAERVGEQREAPVCMVLRHLLDGGAGGDGSFGGGFDVVDDEIEVHRGPVAVVVTLPVRRWRGARAGRFGQEVDRRGAADELRPSVETPAELQAQAVAVEARGALEVVHVDVDEQVHARVFSNSMRSLPGPLKSLRRPSSTNPSGGHARMAGLTGSVESHMRLQCRLRASVSTAFRRCWVTPWPRHIGSTATWSTYISSRRDWLTHASTPPATRSWSTATNEVSPKHSRQSQKSVCSGSHGRPVRITAALSSSSTAVSGSTFKRRSGPVATGAASEAPRNSAR